MMISQDFLGSKYIRAVELKSALARQRQGQCIIIPIFVRECVLDTFKEIKALQGLPSNKKFLSSYGSQIDAGFVEIHKKINDLSRDLLTDFKISQLLHKGGLGSKDAREIQRLVESRKIFLSVPDSTAGREKRKNFLYSVIGKKHFDDWPYEIVPRLDELEQLSRMSIDERDTYVASLMSECLFAIHIMMTEDELDEGFDREQYLLGKKVERQSAFFPNVIWLPSQDTCSGLNEEILMNPAIFGAGSESAFSVMESMNAERLLIIDTLRNPLAPVKTVFMVYDFENDHNNHLRINLKKELEKQGKVLVKFSTPDSSLEKDKEEIQKCEAACIFYGRSIPEWFAFKQSILYDSQIKLVCVDNPDIKLKIDRDVSTWAYNVIIKGRKELNKKVSSFLMELQS